MPVGLGPASEGGRDTLSRGCRLVTHEPSPVCPYIFLGPHSVFGKKKKKSFSKLSAFKNWECFPAPQPKSGFPFSNNNNKSKHFCVTHYVPGAVLNGSVALLLSASEQSCDAGACIIVPTPQLGPRGPPGARALLAVPTSLCGWACALHSPCGVGFSARLGLRASDLVPSLDWRDREQW